MEVASRGRKRKSGGLRRFMSLVQDVDSASDEPFVVDASREGTPLSSAECILETNPGEKSQGCAGEESEKMDPTVSKTNPNDAESPKDQCQEVRTADIVECMEKLRKYEVAYAQRLKAKYFSKKSFNGGDIFEVETTIENEIIKSSRWPCTRSFADPIQTIEDANNSPSAETSAAPSKKIATRKSC